MAIGSGPAVSTTAKSLVQASRRFIEREGEFPASTSANRSFPVSLKSFTAHWRKSPPAKVPTRAGASVLELFKLKEAWAAFAGDPRSVARYEGVELEENRDASMVARSFANSSRFSSNHGSPPEEAIDQFS